MKRIIFSSLVICLLSLQMGWAQEQLQLTENTVIKDASGQVIEMRKFMELMRSGEYTIVPQKDSDGKLASIQLKEATEEEKRMMQRRTATRMNPRDKYVGKQAPDFTMQDRDGNTISMEASKGKVVVLNFWFTACKPCIKEIPELNALYDSYKDNKDVIFASITFNSSSQVAPFLNRFPIHYPVVSDARNVCQQFGVSLFPTNIVIDRTGKYVDYVNGGFPGIGKHIGQAIENALGSD